MQQGPEKEVRKRRHLSPEDKYQIFLESTQAKAKEGGSVGEIMRRWGIHSSDVTRIRKMVEEAAISSFKEKKSRKPKIESRIYQEIKTEKERLETTVLELSAELALLKKKQRSG